MDINRDQKITVREFQYFWHTDDITDFEQADSDKDGNVTRLELTEMFTRIGASGEFDIEEYGKLLQSWDYDRYFYEMPENITTPEMTPQVEVQETSNATFTIEEFCKS